MAEEKKASVLDKGYGDLKETPQVPKWRGEDGSSDSDKHRGDESEGTVHYKR